MLRAWCAAARQSERARARGRVRGGQTRERSRDGGLACEACDTSSALACVRGITESRACALWQDARLAARLRVRFGDNHTQGEHVGACKSVRLELHRPPSALAAAQEPLCSIVGSAQVSLFLPSFVSWLRRDHVSHLASELKLSRALPRACCTQTPRTMLRVRYHVMQRLRRARKRARL